RNELIRHLQVVQPDLHRRDQVRPDGSDERQVVTRTTSFLAGGGSERAAARFIFAKVHASSNCTRPEVKRQDNAQSERAGAPVFHAHFDFEIGAALPSSVWGTSWAPALCTVNN